VSEELGEEGGELRVRAEEGSTQPPAAGWEVVGTGGDWEPDYSLACGPPSSGPCHVTLTLGGGAKELQAHCGGEYVLVEGAWCCGRQVLRQPGDGRYLTVAPGTPCWGSRDSPETSRAAISSPSAGGVCPGHPAAALSRKDGQSRWQYGDGGEHVEGDILVSCSAHHP
jgi:hypothetical protein